MESIFLQIIPLTLAMAIPIPMLKATRYLLMKRPVLHLSIFTLTWGLTLFIILNSTLYLGDYFKAFSNLDGSIAQDININSWLHVALGMLLIRKGFTRFKQNIDTKVASIIYPKLDSKPMSIIITAIKTQLLGAKNSSLLLLTIFILITDEIASSNILLAVLVISIISMLWFSILLLIYFILGKNKNLTINKIKDSLETNQSAIVIFIYIFIGILTLCNGLGGLIQSF